MTTPVPTSNFDFKRVEAVRLHLKLRQEDMAQLFGVSRVSYNRWTKGAQVRAKTQVYIKARLRQILELNRMGWPPPEAMALKPEQRFSQLLDKLD